MLGRPLALAWCVGACAAPDAPAPAEPLPESDQPVAAARVAAHGVVAEVSAGGALRVTRAGRPPLAFDRAIGRPAVLGDGSVVVARRGEGPGESDLWLIARDGAAHALAPAAGPDDLPVALADGRVAFVSGRTGVASLFVVEPASGSVVQLTNRGVRSARDPSFVPPPLRVLRLDAVALVYDAGGGREWRVELASGLGPRVTGGEP
jgi:hypothetical protein